MINDKLPLIAAIDKPKCFLNQNLNNCSVLVGFQLTQQINTKSLSPFFGSYFCVHATKQQNRNNNGNKFAKVNNTNKNIGKKT